MPGALNYRPGVTGELKGCRSGHTCGVGVGGEEAKEVLGGAGSKEACLLPGAFLLGGTGVCSSRADMSLSIRITVHGQGAGGGGGGAASLLQAGSRVR